MLITAINKKDILKEVKKSVNQAKKGITTTMLLSEEIKKPLPISYFNLINKKIKQGIIFKRLGFGRKEDYNKIKERNKLERNNYEFRYITQESEYQRLIIIDKEKLFFGVDGLFFVSEYKPIIEVFVDYFYHNFKKGKI